MRYSWCVPMAMLWLLLAGRAQAQTIHCIDPPVASPSEAACRVFVDSTTRELRLVLQLRAPNDTPIPNRLITFEATSGNMRNSETTDRRGYAEVTWSGPVPPEPIIITASASIDGETTRRQIRVARREPPKPSAPAYITSIAPTGDHSAFANRFLNDDIEVQIEADPATCNRTEVIYEYLSVGTGATPAPTRHPVPALWSELDPGRFGCAAQMRWVLSPAVGEQTLRAWIKRDTSFVVPSDQAGAQRYLRPYVVHATAHAPPAFLAGAAVIDSANGGGVPKLVGLDLSFPTLADLLKHGGLQGPGAFVDRTRIFVGTEFGGDLGKNVYLGLEPLVMLIGPRAADLPVTVATGRRLGVGDNRWFLAGLINAGSIAGLVAQGFGIK